MTTHPRHDPPVITEQQWTRLRDASVKYANLAWALALVDEVISSDYQSDARAAADAAATEIYDLAAAVYLYEGASE